MMRQSRILKYGYHTQMTHRNFQLLRVLGSALRMKSEVRGQKDFICKEEKRKAAWGHAAGGLVGQVGNKVFIAFLVLPEGRAVSQVQTEVSWEEVSHWPIITFLVDFL
jgi:hypothetical protein